MNQIIDIRKYLDPELFRLGLSGFYPSRIKLTNLIKFIRILIYFSIYAQLAALINFVFSTTNKITELALIIALIITQLGFVGKLENFHYKLKKLEELDEIVSQEIFCNVNRREQKIFQLNLKNLQIVVNIYLTICVFSTLFYILPPLWLNIRVGGKHYPSTEKFPFNPDNYYFIVFFIQVTAYGASVWNNGAMDCLFAKHAVIGTCMFKILCKKLKNVTNLVDSMNDNNVANRIRHCIIYHHEIIRYVSIIQNIYSYGTFIQFLSSALVICLLGFQLLVVSSEQVQIGLLIVYLSSMLFQLGLYCWYGHMLMESSNGITGACYSINWHEIEIKEQKMLIIIMERAKKPILLEAAGVFKLTLSTWITVLKSSYSYFALLQNLYSK